MQTRRQQDHPVVVFQGPSKPKQLFTKKPSWPGQVMHTSFRLFFQTKVPPMACLRNCEIRQSGTMEKTRIRMLAAEQHLILKAMNLILAVVENCNRVLVQSQF